MVNNKIIRENRVMTVENYLFIISFHFVHVVYYIVLLLYKKDI